MAPESPQAALSQLMGSRKTVNSQVSVAAQSSLIPSTPQSSGLTNATCAGSSGGWGTPGYLWWSRTTTGKGWEGYRSSQLAPVSAIRTGPFVAARRARIRSRSTPKRGVACTG